MHALIMIAPLLLSAAVSATAAATTTMLACSCANPAWCDPIATQGTASGRPEFFGFATITGASSPWRYYDWDVVTTIAWNMDPALLCFAHCNIFEEDLTDNPDFFIDLLVIEAEVPGIAPKVMRCRFSFRGDAVGVVNGDGMFEIAVESTGTGLRCTNVEHDCRRRCVNPPIPAIALAFDVCSLRPQGRGGVIRKQAFAL